MTSAMKRAHAILLVLALSACDSAPSDSPTREAPATKPAAPRPTTPKSSAQPAGEPTTQLAPELLDPSLSKEQAPETYKAKFTTTKGDFVIEVTRSWAPHGADRFYNLVKIGFFNDIALFRVAKGFVVQFGIHGDPRVSKKWQEANLPADEVKESNVRGMVTYAMAGRPDTRSTQLFINFKDNSSLDQQGFAPLGKVVEGMDVVDSFNGEYGERPTSDQGNIVQSGNSYLRERYPNLDYIKSASIVGDADAGAAASGSAASSGAPAPSASAPSKGDGKGDGSGSGKGDGSGSGKGDGNGAGKGEGSGKGKTTD
jgi:peptidyl-prolyl cis-trans isomerase A (cyclophilin A)